MYSLYSYVFYSKFGNININLEHTMSKDSLITEQWIEYREKNICALSWSTKVSPWRTLRKPRESFIRTTGIPFEIQNTTNEYK